MDEASQGAFPVQYAEYCPHCIAARDMFSQCPTCASRDFPGTSPWSAPGTANSVDFVEDTGITLGVCGTSKGTPGNDYNTPVPGAWGMGPKTTYAPGETITVEYEAARKSLIDATRARWRAGSTH